MPPWSAISARVRVEVGSRLWHPTCGVREREYCSPDPLLFLPVRRLAMSLLSKSVLAPALACLLAGAAFAQRTAPPTSQVPPSSPFDSPLYRSPEVARALDLKKDQIERLDQMTNRLQKRYRDQFDRVGRTDPQVSNARRRELMRTYTQEWNRAAADIFTEKQLNRSQQLELQARGLDVFTDPTVQRRLNLTDEQRRQLADLRTRYNEDVEKMRAPSRLRKEDNLGSWRDYMGRTRTRVNDILNEGQRRTWRDLTGDP